MSGYVKNTWVNQDVERPKTYEVTTNADGSITLTDSFGLVTELGTPVNADNMNHIEDGLTRVSITEYDNTFTYSEDDWVTGIVDGEKTICRSKTDNNTGNALNNDTYWEVLKLGGGGSGYQMFDIVMKDHVLDYAETLGFAPLGTYVYKEAIAGSRYGYPSFYQKCVDEYNDLNNTVIPENWTQPVLTANGTMGGNSFAVSSNVTQLSDNDVFNAFNGVTSGGNYFHSVSGVTTGYIDMYNPKAINVTNIKIYNQAAADRASSAGNIYGSNNGTDWTLITAYTNSVQAAGGTWDISLSGNTNYYKYYRLESTAGGSDSYWVINEIELTATYVLGVQSSNKHRFYDIADKATFDNIFGITGECWYYGIDTTNERIFLPRSTRFKNGTTSDVGGYQPAGLPNLYGEAFVKGSWGNGVFKNSVPSSEARGYNTGAGDVFNPFVFDAQAYNPIYGASNTVEYASTKLIPYMVVGNVANTSAATDVVDITTTENDTLPLFTGIYFDYAPNNVSWVIAGGQVVSGTIYTFAYNELVNELTTPKYNLNVIDVDNMVVGTDYSTYWKVDQTNQTFTCPTKLSYGALTGGVKGNGKALGLVNSDYTDCVLFSQPNDYNRCTNGIPNGQAAPIDMTNNETSNWTGIGGIKGIAIDDAKSGIVATESTTAKLYFKVANAVQNLELLDAGAVLTAVNNVSAKVDNTVHIIESYENGSSGYIVYSNGLCEQWGIRASGAGVQTLFIKTYKDRNYNLLCEPVGQSGQVQNARPMEYNKQPDSFYSYYSDTYYSINWRTCGYLAEGQY